MGVVVEEGGSKGRSPQGAALSGMKTTAVDAGPVLTEGQPMYAATRVVQPGGRVM